MIRQIAPVAGCESKDFKTRAAKLWPDEERELFISYLATNPEAGKLISVSGGVRKIQWGLDSLGKRGVARVIYYYCDDDLPLFLITMSAKNERDDLPASVKPALRAFVASVKGFRRKRSH